jgi:D-alanyl-D-alanine carboxypeptidase
VADDFHPDFGPKLDAFRDLLRNQYGLDTTIGLGGRTMDQQAKLYAQGRTAPGPIVTNAPPGSSYHNFGAAADIIPKNMSEKDAAGVIKQAFAENPDVGLTWGGSFKNLYDPFHVQLGVPLAQLQAAGGPMPAGAAKVVAGLPTGPTPNGTTLDVASDPAAAKAQKLLDAEKQAEGDKQSKEMTALARQLMAAGQAPKANFMQLQPANTGPVRPLPLDLPRLGQGFG